MYASASLASVTCDEEGRPQLSEAQRKLQVETATWLCGRFVSEVEQVEQSVQFLIEEYRDRVGQHTFQKPLRQKTYNTEQVASPSNEPLRTRSNGRKGDSNFGLDRLSNERKVSEISATEENARVTSLCSNPSNHATIGLNSAATWLVEAVKTAVGSLGSRAEELRENVDQMSF
mmetsp:Transcript_15427/g.26094  ORF Transcript_15427/g.26094 Transcript_15427/m.26094 type:complete len:174 (+) Transcript_15427:2541-3062(+)